MAISNHETLPIVDLKEFLNSTGEERKNLASQVDDICRSIGFLIIKNHGVPEKSELMLGLLQKVFSKKMKRIKEKRFLMKKKALEAICQ